MTFAVLSTESAILKAVAVQFETLGRLTPTNPVRVWNTP